mmetsp:Transcript_78576/g.222159  ORF Transcript_78576/g.222159 Transcript_78576/m.222159 type:complete len:225 (-) Transcript_78576:188-862(-)
MAAAVSPSRSQSCAAAARAEAWPSSKPSSWKSSEASSAARSARSRSPRPAWHMLMPIMALASLYASSAAWAALRASWSAARACSRSSLQVWAFARAISHWQSSGSQPRRALTAPTASSNAPTASANWPLDVWTSPTSPCPLDCSRASPRTPAIRTHSAAASRERLNSPVARLAPQACSQARKASLLSSPPLLFALSRTSRATATALSASLLATSPCTSRPWHVR